MDWIKNIEEYSDFYHDVDLKQEYASSLNELIYILAKNQKEKKAFCKGCKVLLTRSPSKQGAFCCSLRACVLPPMYSFCHLRNW